MDYPWLPVVVGYGALITLFLLIPLFPNSWWVAELYRAYEVQRRGPLGRFTPRDLWRSAAVSIGLAAVLLGGSIGAFALMEHFTERTNAGMLADLYFFTLFLLAALAVAVAIQTGVRAISLWRRDRQQAALRRQYSEVVAALVDIVRRHDPLGAITLDERECDYQVGRFLLFLPRCRSYNDVWRSMCESYAMWYGVGNPRFQQDIAPMAQEVWNVWSRGVGLN